MRSDAKPIRDIEPDHLDIARSSDFVIRILAKTETESSLFPATDSVVVVVSAATPAVVVVSAAAPAVVVVGVVAIVVGLNFSLSIGA